MSIGKDDMINTVTGRAATAYGLYINIQDTRPITEIEKLDVEHVAQVVVRVGEEAKEFTLAQFVELLGFEQKG